MLKPLTKMYYNCVLVFGFGAAAMIRNIETEVFFLRLQGLDKKFYPSLAY
jgi:hypothetical protein